MILKKAFCRSANHTHPIRLVKDKCPFCEALETIGILEVEMIGLKEMNKGAFRYIKSLESEKEVRKKLLAANNDIITILKNYIISLQTRPGKEHK